MRIDKIKCPGQADNPACATCTNRNMRIEGHHRNKWAEGENVGETFQRFYLSPPCTRQDVLIRQDITLERVANSPKMRMDVHTKLLALNTLGVANV